MWLLKVVGLARHSGGVNGVGGVSSVGEGGGVCTNVRGWVLQP